MTPQRDTTTTVDASPRAESNDGHLRRRAVRADLLGWTRGAMIARQLLIG